jgi:predicted transcriptional regulator
MADSDTDLVVLTGEVAAAYFANNTVETEKIAAVIATIHSALKAVSDGVEPEPELEETPRATPAQIRKSITPDFLISFIDGRKFKTLRRHLSIQGLTPEDYRERYGLPANYPMVSPNYSAARSQMALAAGLGQGGRQSKAAAKSAPKPRKTKAS